MDFLAEELKVATIRMTGKKYNEIDEVVFFRLFAFEIGLCLFSDNNRYI